MLDRTVLYKLLYMLTDHNPFIAFYKTAYERLIDAVNSQFWLLLNL